uniref:CDP-diacylglycerol--glycerol-3-phosphate 3-phosphatidyltransferase n=1 Tax=Gracilinema caldarium TaxID=215591 RepID=A0A7C3E554_9SPIR
MTSADKITSIRLILAPIFFIVYFLPLWFPALGSVWSVPVLWVIFIIAELTDLFDGLVARSRNEVSDFGKLFDPFSDTLVRITYFLCFVVDGILPAILLMIVLYREFGILFLRTLMMKLGIAMGARSGGKIKAVTYMIAGVLALIASSMQRLSFGDSLFTIVKVAAIVVFAISVIISLSSFADYYRVYKNAKNT